MKLLTVIAMATFGATGSARTSDHAEESSRCENRGPPRVALVVSGGVSLGSYQAGFLYYFVEYLKRLDRIDVSAGRRPLTRPEWAKTRIGVSPIIVATGASAGSVNTTLAALEMCRKLRPIIAPAESLLYRTWHGLAVEKLFPADRPLGHGALHLRP